MTNEYKVGLLLEAANVGNGYYASIVKLAKRIEGENGRLTPQLDLALRQARYSVVNLLREAERTL